jgi:hypothetical protein
MENEMSMLNTSPPTQPARSDLGRRVAEAQSRRERANSGSRLRGVATWDPAAAAGVSPRLMMLAIAFVGATLGLLAYDASRAPSQAEVAQAEEARIAEEVFIQPEVEVAAPSAPNPADAIADYYLLLRQSMYDVAWSRTTGEFQGENYPGGFPDYVRAWTGRPEVEVLAVEVESQGQDEARVVADLHDTGTDSTFRNSFRLRYDAASGFWKIVSITSAW